ncbi:beta-galactosidase, putative [Medicago truncatula]|uniref:Beta-galactosidase, putative n=2 Tax=Medicago truncatula TaxID=3880 RepID=G7IT28_MEDTR|nr:beta-galactosidase, putative [Medicago truncatula]
MSNPRFRTFLTACLALLCTCSLGNPLKWEWASEPMQDTLLGQGTFTASKLLDQKNVTAGASDYLWYMTEVVVNDTTVWGKSTLQVNAKGPIIYSYINGFWWGVYDSVPSTRSFVYDEDISLKRGTNIISLLSVTLGKSNCSGFIDMKETGIVGGHVKLISIEYPDNVLDLSKSTWSYKVGMNGMARKFYDPKSNGVPWIPRNVSIGVPMTWYKTTFKTPEGSNLVVLDLIGLQRGKAWVNGQCIGRYRLGENSSFRYYAVPRPFFNKDVNTLVLFEELGLGKGPFNVSVDIISIESRNFVKWDQGCSS